MNTEENNYTEVALPFQYSDEELSIFKENIDKKLETANKELEFLKSFVPSPDDEKRVFLPDRKADDTGFEKEQIKQMIQRQETFINHLSDALARIENKTYGICRVTGKLIDKQRLIAVPHATLSLEAKLGLDKKTQEAAAAHVPAKPKNKREKKQKGNDEKQSEKVSDLKYSDNDLREFKTLILNKIDEANDELKYLKTVLRNRQKNIKVEDYEDMSPAEVESLISRKETYIHQLDDAYQRTKNKTYGIDESSGKLIPKQILIQHLIITQLPTPEKPAAVIDKEATAVRTCRICGCIDNDCLQCIEKTGQPCHWIDTDLCSACEEDAMKESELQTEPVADVIEPVSSSAEDETLIINPGNKIELSEAEKNHLAELENNPSSNNNDNDMNFFSQLAGLGRVDLTMRIMEDKNGKLTIGIEPGLKSHLKPLNFTGTPQEFDEGFFKTVMPSVNEIKGIVTNLEDVKKDLTEKAKSPTPKAESKPSESHKPAAKKPEKKSAPQKKKPGKVVSELLGRDQPQEPAAETEAPVEPKIESATEETTASE